MTVALAAVAAVAAVGLGLALRWLARRERDLARRLRAGGR